VQVAKTARNHKKKPTLNQPKSGAITRKKTQIQPKTPSKNPKTPSKNPKIELLPVHLPKSGPEHTRVFPDPHPVQVAKGVRRVRRKHAGRMRAGDRRESAAPPGPAEKKKPKK
jgi:hypothetical protein